MNLIWEMSVYFISGGHANTFQGDGVLTNSLKEDAPTDSFVYDSENPVPSFLDSASIDTDFTL